MPRHRCRHPSTPVFPSAQTLYRLANLLPDGADWMSRFGRTLAVDPEVVERGGDAVARIESARALPELLDLAHHVGLAELAWHRRFRTSFRLGAAPAVTERLKATATDPESARGPIEERLIAALRWCGGLGAQGLIDAFPTLTDFGASLACMALGQLGARGSGDLIVSFYERVFKAPPRDTLFVGALWGLVDLGDERARFATIQHVRERLAYNERDDFLVITGDGTTLAVIGILAALQIQRGQKDGIGTLRDVGGAICHRLGRARAIEEVSASDLTQFEAFFEPAEFVDALLKRDREDLEERFPLAFPKPFAEFDETALRE